MIQTIDEYIDSCPIEIQDTLQNIRKIIAKTAPKAKERIAYGMPTFTMSENLVHFAAFKNHIWWYPTPSAIVHFAEKLTKYKTSKWAVQFPFDNVPYELIQEMVEFRLTECQKDIS